MMASTTLLLSAGKGTATPSSLRIRSAFRRITRSTVPSTGLSFP